MISPPCSFPMGSRGSPLASVFRYGKYNLLLRSRFSRREISVFMWRSSSGVMRSWSIDAFLESATTSSKSAFPRISKSIAQANPTQKRIFPQAIHRSDDGFPSYPAPRRSHKAGKQASGPSIRSHGGGPTAWTMASGASSTSAIPPCCQLIWPVQQSSFSRETASPGTPP